MTGSVLQIVFFSFCLSLLLFCLPVNFKGRQKSSGQRWHRTLTSVFCKLNNSSNHSPLYCSKHAAYSSVFAHAQLPSMHPQLVNSRQLYSSRYSHVVIMPSSFFGTQSCPEHPALAQSASEVHSFSTWTSSSGTSVASSASSAWQPAATTAKATNNKRVFMQIACTVNYLYLILLTALKCPNFPFPR